MIILFGFTGCRGRQPLQNGAYFKHKQGFIIISFSFVFLRTVEDACLYKTEHISRKARIYYSTFFPAFHGMGDPSPTSKISTITKGEEFSFFPLIVCIFKDSRGRLSLQNGAYFTQSKDLFFYLFPAFYGMGDPSPTSKTSTITKGEEFSFLSLVCICNFQPW